MRRLACLLLLVSCVRRVPPLTEALDDARSLVAKGGGTARDRALAGFAAWMYDADVQKAEHLFSSALTIDAKEPYALMGQLLLARRAGLPNEERRLALPLLEGAPKHPLAIIAARSLVDHGSVAVSLDETLLSAAPKILPTLRGDAAHLFRLALNSLALERGAIGPTRWAKEAGLVTEQEQEEEAGKPR
jgi:cellulose synthase operon protein C